MATTIRELLVRLGVKADATAAKSFDERITRVKQTMIAAFGAATALGYGLFKLARATSAAGDDAATAAGRIGISTEAYQEMQFVANRADMSIEELTGALRVQARVLDQAGQKGGEAAAVLDRLGIAADDPRLKDQAGALGVLVEKMRGLETSSERVAVAQKIWGRGGTALVPLIEDQTLSIEALRKQAHQLGYIMDAEAIAASQQFDDTLKDAQLTLMGFRNTIGLAVMPVFNDLITRTRDYAVANREIIEQKVGEWAEDLGDGIEWLGKHFSTLVTVAEVFGALWVGGKVAIGIIDAIGLVKDLRIAFASLSKVMGIGASALAGWVAVAVGAIAQVVAMGLAVQDLYVFLTGGKSAIEEWTIRHEQMAGVVGHLARLLRSLLEVARYNFDLFRTWVADPAMDLIRASLEGWGMAADLAADAIGRLFGLFNVDLGSSPLMGLLDKVSGAMDRYSGFKRGDLGINTRPGSALSEWANPAPSLPAVATRGAAGSSSSRTFQGGPLTITGAGISAAEAERLGRTLLSEQARQSAAVFAGGEL